MLAASDRLRDYARILLAAVRLFNGAMALFGPRFLIRRLGLDDQTNLGMVYPFRMFGIRTLIIGGELLLPDGEIRRHAQRMAVLIHCAHALTALAARPQGQNRAGQPSSPCII